MRISRMQLTSIIRKEAQRLTEAARKGRFKFEDASGIAHSVKLYDAVGELHRQLMAQLGDPDEAAQWFREVIEDAVDSQISDSESQNSAMRGASAPRRGGPGNDF